jgi:adenylyltransferase/sulfurtransferase
MRICRPLPLLALSACIVAACSAPQPEPQSSAAGASHAKTEAAAATEMNVESLKQRLDAKENVFVLDVRGPQELEQNGMIEGSVNIPIGDLEARLAEVPKDKPLAIYCHRGGRASRAAALLREKGYTEPIEYGGISAWKEKGYAVAFPPKAEGSGE